MIRFQADTWQDAVLRPLAMADPNGWVYIEILAPDFRFAIAILLALVVAGTLLVKGGHSTKLRPVVTFFLLVFASFIPWMETTGNGRYFMPYIVAVGPLCVGLIYLLPSTRSLKVSLTAVALGLQGFALYQNSPWNAFGSWELVAWKEAPYFALDISSGNIRGDETFVTLPSMTPSVVAPLFPDSVRWVNLSPFNGVDIENAPPNYQPVQAMLKTATRLFLFQKAQPHEMQEGGIQPSERAINALNAYLRPHRLSLTEPTNCRLMKSASADENTVILAGKTHEEQARLIENAGFWICPLAYPVAVPKVASLTIDELRAKSVLDAMERVCPRFFQPGQSMVAKHEAGFARNYGSSDSTLIWTRSDELWVQNMRALNPERIGSAEDVLKPGFKFDCTSFRGRAGLPWERKI